MGYALEGAKWGDPTLGTAPPVITYSFVTTNFGNEPYVYDYPLDPTFQNEIRAAFAQWSAVAPIVFQELPDGAAANIRAGWTHMDGAYGTLAQTTYEYQNGSMVQTWIGFDDADAWTDTAAGHALPTGFLFSAVAEHEIGHTLGLDHWMAETALMNPIMSVNALQPSDVAGVQALYGAGNGVLIADGYGAGTAVAHDALTALPPLDDPRFVEVLLANAQELAAEHGTSLGELVGRLDPATQQQVQTALGAHTGTELVAQLAPIAAAHGIDTGSVLAGLEPLLEHGQQGAVAATSNDWVYYGA